MKFGKVEITFGANEIVIGAVVILTFCLLWKTGKVENADLFKEGFIALVSWGAGYATGKTKKGETNV
jgi:hypothetical protein